MGIAKTPSLPLLFLFIMKMITRSIVCSTLLFQCMISTLASDSCEAEHPPARRASAIRRDLRSNEADQCMNSVTNCCCLSALGITCPVTCLCCLFPWVRREGHYRHKRYVREKKTIYEELIHAERYEAIEDLFDSKDLADIVKSFLYISPSRRPFPGGHRFPCLLTACCCKSKRNTKSCCDNPWACLGKY